MASSSKPKRHGGKVTKAWPAHGAPKRSKPATVLTQWLARAVGPVGMTPPKTTARAAASIEAGPLRLVRSYETPTDDPSYERVTNWSWTYDSGIVGAAFAATGERTQSAQLLDQLAALQHTDGSLELVFNVATGASAPIFRAGTVAWVGLAFVTYDRNFNDTRYTPAAEAAADYLLALRRTDGLIRGGPDVDWASTEHNVIAYTLLSNLAERLAAVGDSASADRYRAAAGGLGDAIDAALIVREAGTAWVRQGAGDDVQPIDAQALGAVYLAGRGDTKTAAQVLAHAQQTSYRENAPGFDARTGSLSGFVPYYAPEAPEVLWFEGLGEMRSATSVLGLDTGALDNSMERWWAPQKAQGLPPVQANTTVTKSRYGEYHVWPAAAAGAWVILSHAQGEKLLVSQAKSG